jgi:CRISPR-associated protein Cas5d
MLALSEVEYIITARVALSALGVKGSHNLKTYCDEIERRAKKGKCFHRPALGVREFAADFEWEPDPQAALERRASDLWPDRRWQQIWPEEDLGLMLYDVFDHRKRSAGFRWLTEEEKSQAQAAALTSDRESGKKLKKSINREAPRFEGSLVQPQASFFHARVKDACVDCDPQRVKMIIKPLEAGYAA